MARIPQRPNQAAAARSISVATTPSGRAAVATQQLSNAIEGDDELMIVLKNTTEYDRSEIVIFPGADRQTGIDRGFLPEGVDFEAEGFESRAAFLNYFSKISTNVYGLRLETSDVANFTGQISYKETRPSGLSRTVRMQLSKYRVPVGDNYSETIEIGEKDINIVLWPALDMALTKLKANSTITMYLAVRGWNKTQTLSAFESDIIA